MTITLDPIEIEESEESRRAREEQARRDDDARRAAAEALDSVGPQLDALAGGGDPPEQSSAERAARAPAQPGSTFASVPGARRTGSTGVVLPGRPAGPPPDRSQPMRQEAVTASPSPRMDAPAVASGSDPQMRAQQSPTFRAPQPDMRVLREPPRDPQRDTVRSEVMAQRDAIARKPERPEPGRMDEGLPSEGQIGDARARDVMRMIAAALAGGFAGYSGRGGGVRARREADELTQQRQQGIARREAAKGEAVQQMDARAEREAAREQEMTLAQQRLAESARERDAGLDIQRQRIGLQERGLEAELAEGARTREADAALDSAESVPSAQMRTALMVRLSQEHPAQRAAALEALGGAARIQQMTGREAQQALAQLARPQVYRGTGGGGSGGAATPRDGMARPARRTALLEAGRNAGLSDGVMATMDDEELGRELAIRGRATAQPQGVRRQILPGVTVDGGMVDDQTFRNHREGLIAGRRAGDSLRAIRSVQERYGAGAIISQEARAELAAPLQRMLTRVGQMRSSGVIQPSELPTIQSFLPDPTSGQQVAMSTFNARLRSFVDDVENDVRATLEADGASAEEIEAALRYVRGEGGGGRQRPQSSARRFRITLGRESSERPLTPEQARRLEERGYTVEAL